MVSRSGYGSAVESGMAVSQAVGVVGGTPREGAVPDGLVTLHSQLLQPISGIAPATPRAAERLATRRPVSVFGPGVAPATGCTQLTAGCSDRWRAGDGGSAGPRGVEAARLGVRAG